MENKKPYLEEILKIISDFEQTKEAALDSKSIREFRDVCLRHHTSGGICSSINMLFGARVGAATFKRHLGIDGSRYIFTYNGYNTIHDLLRLPPNLEEVNWRKISIKLCEMRIEYLKKFI